MRERFFLQNSENISTDAVNSKDHADYFINEARFYNDQKTFLMHDYMLTNDKLERILVDMDEHYVGGTKCSNACLRHCSP